MGETMQQIEGLEMRMLAESGSLQSQTMRNLGHNSISLQCVFGSAFTHRVHHSSLKAAEVSYRFRCVAILWINRSYVRRYSE